MRLTTETAIVVCEKCGMPVRVIWQGGEAVKVLAPCGHVKLPAEERNADA